MPIISPFNFQIWLHMLCQEEQQKYLADVPRNAHVASNTAPEETASDGRDDDDKLILYETSDGRVFNFTMNQLLELIKNQDAYLGQEVVVNNDEDGNEGRQQMYRFHLPSEEVEAMAETDEDLTNAATLMDSSPSFEHTVDFDD
ncbi:hypothetical protein MPSEU_000157000 [Mayamaea pseudoterrestris]|nr:hypothetical protein MPSEU_000157000 [Mayamaea pseudoterrestris]